jgi:hypothetical protein
VVDHVRAAVGPGADRVTDLDLLLDLPVAPDTAVGLLVEDALPLALDEEGGAKLLKRVAGRRVVAVQGGPGGHRRQGAAHGVLVKRPDVDGVTGGTRLVADVLDFGADVAIGGGKRQARVVRSAGAGGFARRVRPPPDGPGAAAEGQRQPEHGQRHPGTPQARRPASAGGCCTHVRFPPDLPRRVSE